ELSDTQAGGGVKTLAESVLEAALEEKDILDAGRAERGTGAGFLEAARVYLRSAGSRRAEYKTRRIDSYLAHRRFHFGDRPGTRARPCGRAHGDFRTRRRRK